MESMILTGTNCTANTELHVWQLGKGERGEGNRETGREGERGIERDRERGERGE